MTPYGLLKFRFDKSMNVPANFTMINGTVLDVQITENRGINGTEDGTGKARALQGEESLEGRLELNYTWIITSFQKRSMDLQLFFDEAF